MQQLCHAMANNSRYSNYLSAIGGACSTKQFGQAETDTDRNRLDDVCRSATAATPSGGGTRVLTMGLNCLFSVLTDLNRKDPELCCNALNSLQLLLQSLPVMF